MWLTIPSKSPALAKRRLASLLSPQQRRGLHVRMLEDVLTAARGVPLLDGICLVSESPEIAAIARRFDAVVLPAPEGLGHRPAVALAARHLASLGIGQMMTLPGDIPLVGPGDIETVLAAHRGANAMTFVPDHQGRGSNCIVFPPHAAEALRIGCGDFDTHVEAAARLGFEPGIVHNAKIALDIDEPDDLSILLRWGPHTRAGAFLLETEACGYIRRAAAVSAETGARA